MRVRGCEECERLWREYRDATFKYVKLDGQAKMGRDALRSRHKVCRPILRLPAYGATSRSNSHNSTKPRTLAG